MNRRYFLRFLALSPLAVPTAMHMARHRPVGTHVFVADELHEMSVVNVHHLRAMRAGLLSIEECRAAVGVSA